MKDKLMIDGPCFGNDNRLMVIYTKNRLLGTAFTTVATAFQDRESSFSTPNELIAYVKELFGDLD